MPDNSNQQQQQQEDNAILQEDNNDATIQPTATDDQQGAGAKSPEDTPDAMQAVINQQNETIATLLERTNSLTAQINELIRNGAVITDANSSSTQQQAQRQQQSLADDYVPLKDLGAEIGKR